MRGSVRRYAEAMEAKLAKNDWKPGWGGATVGHLFHRMLEEMDELFEAIEKGDPAAVQEEAVDVGNLAHMIFDVAAGCPDGERGGVNDE